MFFKLLGKAFETEDGRQLAANALRGLLAWKPTVAEDAAGVLRSTYPDLGTAAEADLPAMRDDAIFLTARFRSGSTLLWNIFRHLDGHTAYYEPLNERRWFDLGTRGTHTDHSHRQVEDYWREYEGLESLGRFYRQHWTDRNLYMDADFWDPAMKSYLQLLLSHGPHRPVLQLNRVDFRLPWLRRHFPDAQIIHLYRHPRDQWTSALLGTTRCPHEIHPLEFSPYDEFYLLNWCRDLRYHFPFLDPESADHPYQLSYYLWKLSYLFGASHADISLAYEQLIEDPQGQLAGLFSRLGIVQYDMDRLLTLFEAPQAGRWRQYADDRWFRVHEARCEATLQEFLSSGQSAFQHSSL